MKSTKTRRYYPLPEALPRRDGGDPTSGVQWQINESGPGAARTDVVGHRMEVPLGEDRLSRNYRLHEMGHANWSPVEAPGVLARKHAASPEALQHAEDLRVNTGLSFAAGTPLDGPGLHADEDVTYTAKAIQRIGEVDPKRAFRLATYELVSSMHTGSYERLQQAFQGTRWEKAHRVAEATWNRMAHNHGFHGQVLPFARTVEAAQYLDEILGMMDDYFDNDARDDTLDDLKGMVPDKSPPDEEAEDEEAPPPDDRQLNNLLDRLPVRFNEVHPQWAAMTIERPPLRRSRRTGKAAKRVRSSEFGVAPKYIHRACSDGRVFGYKRRQPGGAVLIDGSGSMRITAAEVRRLVELAPQSLVAIYSGDTNSGVLRVLAREGRMVDEALIDRPSRNNNAVDGPALEWMIKQKQTPMVWVSDGMVTGDAKTGFSMKLALQCENLCRKKRVARVLTVADAIRYFEAYHKRR